MNIKNPVVGVDIGGTHVTACVVDIDKATIVEGTNVRASIDPLQDKEYVIRSWADVIASCINRLSTFPQHIGIAMPGPFDYENGISLISGLHKYECLYGLNVKELLGDALQLPVSHIRFMNDATAFLAGEAKAWAGKGCRHVVGITLGTGLGSAIYINGCFEDGDLYSFPFRESRAEEYLGSRWFVGAYGKQTAKAVTGAKELAAMAPHDAVAQGIFTEFGHTLAEVLIKRFATRFPERIVIGGNIAKAWDLFHPHCAAHLLQSGFDCELLPARLGEDAALIGAAFLWE
ncbi:MAG: ROK family protein [Agriterribacter sp.]